MLNDEMTINFSQRAVALLQLSVTVFTGDGILKECDRLEATFSHIPSQFKWAIDYKRFQVEQARGNRDAALAHLKEAIAAAPYNSDLIDDYKKLVERTTGFSNLVVVLASKRSEADALRLAEQIDQTGVPYVIISGDDTPSIPHARAVQVATSDCHEDIPRKVAAALSWVRENVGTRVGVLKMNSNMVLRDGGKLLTSLRHLAAEGGYFGFPTGDLEHDRCLHWGLCQNQELNRRVYGRPVLRPWASSEVYYLGPRALEKAVLSLMRFPGLFEGEYYEDKLIGDVLVFEGEELTKVDGPADFGLAVAADGDVSIAVAAGYEQKPLSVSSISITQSHKKLPVLRLSDWDEL